MEDAPRKGDSSLMAVQVEFLMFLTLPTNYRNGSREVFPRMAELADAVASEAAGEIRGGSTPPPRTIYHGEAVAGRTPGELRAVAGEITPRR